MDDYKILLWAFMIGVSIAALYMFFVRKTLSGFVQKLLAGNAFSPESALSMEELGQKPTFFLMRSLKKGSDLSRTVMCENGRYYIPEDRIQKDESKYKSNTGGIIILLVTIAVFAVGTLICVYAFPHLIDSLTGLFK